MKTALLLWLVAGVLSGAAVTAALAIGVWHLFADDVPAEAAPPPRFVEESAAAGIDQAYDGEFEFFVGGGVAVLDCDEDWWPDLYFAGGENPSGLYRNRSPINGELAFEIVDGSGADLTEVTGAYPLDVDSDGLTDLAVLRVGENVMLRGRGDCRFERANETWGIDGGEHWTAAFSATWEEGQRRPTLAFGNYLEISEDGERSCTDHQVFRPDGDAYQGPLTLSPGWCTLSILFTDWDRSGRRDLRMTNDRHYYREGQEQLWRFEWGEEPRLYTEREGWQPMQIWGMGIAGQDLTGDGFPEYFLTSQSDNKLQTLAEGPDRPEYTDIAFARGVTAHRPFAGDVILPSTAWHPDFDDVNNDSLMDLYVSKGNVEAQDDYAAEDPSNLLLGNPDGSFTEVAEEAGIVNFARARGAAVVDLNLDGMLDLVEVNRRENIELWRNLGWGDSGEPEPMGNWVGIRLSQPAPNTDAVGSWVQVKVGNRNLEREVSVGGGHAGGQMGWLHFGVGDADSVEVRVQWPDGETGEWMNAAPNQWLVIERGSNEATVWDPEAAS